MKLAYVWIEDFREFSNEGFNFSSEFKFEYSKENHELIVQQCNKLPMSFYGEKINDVTGVIGKNGAGKSNLLELVCMLVKGSKTLIHTDFILITEENSRFKCHTGLSKNQTLRCPSTIECIHYEGNLDPLNVVFFSNVFDQRKNSFSSEVSDLSVNKDHSVSYNFRRKNISDFSKQINFISNELLFSHLDMETPTEVLIINKTWINSGMQFTRNIHNGKELADSISRIRHVLLDNYKFMHAEGKFILSRKYSFFIDVLTDFFNAEVVSYNDMISIANRIQQLTESIHSNEYGELFNSLLLVISQQIDQYFSNEEYIINNKKYNKVKKVETVRKQLLYLQSFEDELHTLNLNYTKVNNRNSRLEYFTFAYNKNSKSFLNKYIGLFNDDSFLEFGWTGISSGQKAYLNMFSSIYHELKMKRKESDLLLCIDEGDLYLHPKWQVEFFEKLVEILPLIYKIGKIQLLISSHSPFLLANMPKQSLIVLNKLGQKSIVEKFNNDRDTFGGNLYDLYKNQFFLGNIQTSSFADKKIKRVLQLSKRSDLRPEEINEIKDFINIMGDEIIEFTLKKRISND